MSTHKSSMWIHLEALHAMEELMLSMLDAGYVSEVSGSGRSSPTSTNAAVTLCFGA